MTNDLTSSGLHKITRRQIKPAAKVMARAFHEDPLMIFYIPDPVEREKKLPHLYEFLLKFTFKNGEAYATSKNLEGIAVVFLAPNFKMNIWQGVWYGGISLYFKLGPEVMKKMMNQPDIEIIHNRLAPKNHWYLEILAVDPKLQGRGFGRKLLKPVLQRSKQTALPCYLETQQPNNVSLYQKFGFKLLESNPLSAGKVMNHSMMWDSGD